MQDAVFEGVTARQGRVLSVSRSGFHCIAYTEWGGPEAERVALCVHGLTRQGRDFDPLAVVLMQNGYRVVCRSRRPREKRSSR